MIVLDTNVLSELMRSRSASLIPAWSDRFDPAEMYTTTVTQAEILSGLAMMPQGRRRAGLEGAANRMFAQDFRARILAFDDMAVPHYADIVAARRLSGRASAPLDSMIAAIARAHGAAVATRDTKDFEGFGLTLHNPWSEGGD